MDMYSHIFRNKMCRSDFDIKSAILVVAVITSSCLLVWLTITTIHTNNNYIAGLVEAQQVGNNTTGESNSSAVNLHNISNINTTLNQVLPDLFEKVERSVVQITTTMGQAAAAIGHPQFEMGSGLVYDTNGHIITNYHVITPNVTTPLQVGKAVDINVAFNDGTVYPATVVGADPFSDIAVIQVPFDARNKMVPLTFGNSTSLRVGEQVIAIGNPFGLSGSMTEGIISGLGRLIPATEASPSPQEIPTPFPPPPTTPDDQLERRQQQMLFSIPDIIQTDAPINPGNSGGPLLNLEGEVIGMNSALFSSTGNSAGIGFAIPSNTITKVVPSLITSGYYEHPWIGVSGVDLTPELAKTMNLEEARGFLVTEITAGSPADKAGVLGGYKIGYVDGREVALGGDVIVAIDNQTIRKFDDISTYLEREKHVGDKSSLAVIRNAATQHLNMTLAARPGSTSQDQQFSQQLIPVWLGLSGIDLTPELADSMGLKNDTRGFLVTQVTSGGPADKVGLRGGYKIDNANGREVKLGGDVIVAIDNSTITSLKDILSYLGTEKGPGDTIQLSIVRNGHPLQASMILGNVLGAGSDLTSNRPQ
jgi:serine protease Do